MIMSVVNASVLHGFLYTGSPSAFQPATRFLSFTGLLP